MPFLKDDLSKYIMMIFIGNWRTEGSWTWCPINVILPTWTYLVVRKLVILRCLLFVNICINSKCWK